MIDVPKLLNELDQAGITNAKVARQLNVYRSSVYRWKLGNEIKLKHWRELVKMHEKIVTVLHDKQPLSI